MRKPIACSILLLTAIAGAHRDSRAQVIGGIVSQQEAERHGLTRAWYVQADLDRATGEVVDATLDSGTLFVQTNRARLQAIHAETGHTLWSVRVGNERYPCMTPAASADYVATINGSTVYLIDRKTGREAWNKQLSSVPGAGPAVTRTHVFVPMVNGTIFGHELSNRSVIPFFYKSFGRILVPPVVTAESLAWTTEQGYLYLMNLAEPSRLKVNFRLDTHDKIESRPGYWTPFLYGVSLDGYVYAVHEETGRIHWKYSTAEPIFDSPSAVGGKVYVCVDKGGMFCLNSETGEHEWYSPGCRQFIAASPTRVYASDRLNRLLILDGKTGARLDSMLIPGVRQRLRNVQTDRILLTTDRGMIQCLHETALTQPVVYTPPPLKVKPKLKTKRTRPAPEEGEAPAAENADLPEEAAAPADENPFDAGGENAGKPGADGAPAEDAPADGEDNPFE